MNSTILLKIDKLNRENSLKLTNSISYKNKKYPTRTLNVYIDNEPRKILIATHSLDNVIRPNRENNNSIEQDIDDKIYFYVADNEINLSELEIVTNCLHEKLELIKCG